MADLVNRVVDLAADFELQGIVEDAPVFQRHQEAAHDHPLRRPGIGELHAAAEAEEREGAAGNPPRRLGGHPGGPSYRFARHRLPSRRESRLAGRPAQ